MIISASRRTDIPTNYSSWLFNRIKEGYVLVRNPMNIHQVGKINLSPEVVDGIVFWTKNPAPMLGRLDEFKPYTYYFQFTLNAYGKDVEPNVPSKKDFIIPTFQALAKKIGKERVIWRYDPIFLNAKYTAAYHLKYFENLCKLLSGYTEKCTVSFLDYYKKTERNTAPLKIQNMTLNEKFDLMWQFAQIATKYNLKLDTCAEEIDLDKFGITHAHCIDRKRLESIGSIKLRADKDKNQRQECGCIASIDIGAYNTCKNGCLYCYANFNSAMAEKNFNQHDPNSPLLFGQIDERDVIKERAVKSCRDCQTNLFDIR